MVEMLFRPSIPEQFRWNDTEQLSQVGITRVGSKHKKDADNMHGAQHPKADIDTPYLKRYDGGRGLEKSMAYVQVPTFILWEEAGRSKPQRYPW